MPMLQVVQGPNRGSFYFLEQGLNILGRDPKCNVVLYDTCASRQHIKIACDRGKSILSDLQSTNGTLLNGLTVTQTPFELREGDRIRIGNTELLFVKKEPRQDLETEILEPDFNEAYWLQSFQEMMVVGQSPKMKEIISQVFKAAPMDIPVLITGESGTGKELIARSIHRNSSRRRAPFHAINCATLESLADSELFGHEKGAFTGAVAQRQGIFEMANGGTLFLDEIGDAPLEVQVKLLRVLETGSFYRVGGNVLLHTHVRIITATNQNLPQKMKAGTFREDLYYRLQGLEIALPPLRERKEDIKILAEHFLKILNSARSQPIKKFEEEALKLLENYPFPGNVREMKNLIERVLILRTNQEESTLSAKEIQPYLLPPSLAPTPLFKGSLQEIERDYIQQLYQETQRNKSETARILGIDRATLYAKLKKYNIES